MSERRGAAYRAVTEESGMKNALITGASGGIGAACARALAADGLRVILNYNRHREAAEALACELDGLALRADVSDEAQVKEMLSVCGGVDVLVCCAGVASIKLFSDTTQEDWARIMGVNLGGTVNCIRGVLPHMLWEKAGSIVTVSSIWGQTGASCEVAYSASKAAVIGLTRSLAKELAPSSIRVNCVCPGVIDTAMLGGLTDETRQALIDETPLGRLGTPEDVAKAVRYLASEDASFVTGQVLGVNGGFLI